jgi:hypothetical protein
LWKFRASLRHDTKHTGLQSRRYEAGWNENPEWIEVLPWRQINALTFSSDTEMIGLSEDGITKMETKTNPNKKMEVFFYESYT